ncbi:AMP-binding protein [Williamsia serinedens]|uniref:Acetyl-CoA synthetase n=1 Tax=Williamsia serinedens TaxID=391736 RepID=A0ABT1H6Z0_9NOCA|nr:AMP-binding protein [Williamsia serinedens]MCP2162990.1 acetyl-CoA synthetase [Williamsia serinedens]
MTSTGPTEAFRAARAALLENADDLDAARAAFAWPELDRWNWATDWFDVLAAEREAAGDDRPALWLVEEDGSEQRFSFPEMRDRSIRVAAWLREQGVAPGHRVLLMLANQVELWEVMLAAIRLGAVVIPATTQLSRADAADRISRGGVDHVIVRGDITTTIDEAIDSLAGDPSPTRIAVGDAAGAWLRYPDAGPLPDPSGFVAHETHADDTLLLYFTSGTTSRPKLVEHTHASYPVGHLSTMYWIGLQPGDVHLNVSSPGWAKHAWSNVFAPWNAGACVFLYNYTRFDAAALMAQMQRCGVTTFCAPPTVWRMLIQSDLSRLSTPPRLAVGAGEPLNPEVIDRVRDAWGVTIRDGFGQTETTVQIANTPGQPIKDGSMGRPCPGYTVGLVDPATGESGVTEGEICVSLEQRPLGLMVGYHGDPDRTAAAMADGWYHTGDVGSRDDDGYITYVGRTDDVFKSSDYRISPFELESVLLEHDAVAEAAVVPAPDELRLSVPKAYIVLAAGWSPDEQTAAAIFAHSRDHLAGYKRVRRITFGDLPKTISGKIRRVELRAAESAGDVTEFREEQIDATGPVSGRG